MSRHSVAEAKNNLSDLIDRALEGEGVVITPRGRPVVKLTPISSPPKPITPDALDLLVRQRVGRRMPRENAAAAMRKLHDEWTR